MFGYVVTLLMLVQSANPIAAKDDIKANLDRAEDLYYEAKFNDSIQLLLRVNEELQSKPDRLSDKVNTKLQLALANIGLNDTEKAKSYLIEMYTLDPNATLDPQKVSPKVIALAGDAKTAMTRIRCQTIGDDARNNLKSGNAAAIRKLLSSPDNKCVDMVAIGPDAADLLYKTGMEAYKNSDYHQCPSKLPGCLEVFSKTRTGGAVRGACSGQNAGRRRTRSDSVAEELRRT